MPINFILPTVNGKLTPRPLLPGERQGYIRGIVLLGRPLERLPFEPTRREVLFYLVKRVNYAFTGWV